MAEENDTPRTEQPTPRRLEQSREEGQVARSRELSTSLTVLAAGVVFYAAGPKVVDGFAGMLRRGLSLSTADAFDSGEMLMRLVRLALQAADAVAPLMIALLVVALLGPTLVGGWLISAKAVQPDFSRLPPLRGLKNIFSWHGAGYIHQTSFSRS